MNLTPADPDARERVDRARVLTNVMLENPDAGPNYVLLMILAEQLQHLHDIFEAAERHRIQDARLPL
ncbi:hypothetical protein [[Enterobacter] lignolyticus]|nr:hypothetical protein [[Enterobacter] lignolyticus]